MFLLSRNFLIGITALAILLSGAFLLRSSGILRGQVGGICGDEVCDSTIGETSLTCGFDCGAACEDGYCDSTESSASCAADCGGICGNGSCETGETSLNCGADCGPSCGDGYCDSQENSWGCSDDCGGICGDNKCSSNENMDSCPYDCDPAFSPQIGERDGVPIYSFKASQTRIGFVAPLDAHVLFTCPEDTSPSISVITAHRDPTADTAVRYWGYEYSGNENENMEAERTGLDLFDGRFHLSQAELAITGDRFSSLHTENMTMVARKRYYVIIDGSTALTTGGSTAGAQPFIISCIDSDQDLLHDAWERVQSTNAYDADTDDDGLTDGAEFIDHSTNPSDRDTDDDLLQDGTELSRTAGHDPDTDVTLFIPDADPSTSTDPLLPDTDNDSAPDGTEDANGNGRADEGETDPNDPTSVRLCGNGRLDGAEGCDDGDTDNDDGCSSSCTVEDGFQCSAGEPSNCKILVPEME